MDLSPERKSIDNTQNYDFLSQIAAQNEYDLREYTEKVKGELKDIEDQTLKDLISLNPEVAKLYNELTQTDRILGKISNFVLNQIIGNLEVMLGSFQTELQDISAQVDLIKERSAVISTTAANKKEFEKGNTFLNNYN